MSVNPVTSGLGKVNQAGAQATSQVGSQAKQPAKIAKSATDKPVQQIQNTASTVRDTDQGGMPGGFPSDDAPRKSDDTPPPEISFGGIWSSFRNWVSGLYPQALDGFEGLIQRLLDRYFPAPKQAQMYEGAMNRPISSTFIACQLICCGVPLLVFLAGVFVFAAVSILLWAVLSLLILGPVLLVTSMMGISMWGWGWLLYGLVRWVDQNFLGGIISRFFLPRMQTSGTESGDRDQDQDEEKKDT